MGDAELDRNAPSSVVVRRCVEVSRRPNVSRRLFLAVCNSVMVSSLVLGTGGSQRWESKAPTRALAPMRAPTVGLCRSEVVVVDILGVEDRWRSNDHDAALSDCALAKVSGSECVTDGAGNFARG